MDAAVISAAPTRADDPNADPLRDALVDAVGADYEIVRLIGRGGMGAVYLARDRALERLVAIKVLPPGSATDAGVLERFRREAKTVASLQHPGIVPLYAFGERRGLCWFVMGYVRGESLATRLERDTALDPDTTRTLLAQVADALDHAHRQGIVHRDIKPDNILLDDSTGRALLTDFGIARADTLQVGTSLTQVGSVMGTPHYMSPEQATAEPNIDGRSDVYSVGVIGYQMLSGQLPFDGRTFRELLMQHVSATPKPLATIAPDVPTDMADAVMRCLEKDPSRRFADARSFRGALGGDAYDDESISYELGELRHVAAYALIAVLLGLTFGATAALRTAPKMLGLTPLGWLLVFPAVLIGYLFKLREARQRGFDWRTIKRVVTLPPRWWWLWWPRAWRRSGDVFERLPAKIRTARVLNSGIMLLLLLEIPLLAWGTDDAQLALRDRVPSVHAFYAVAWMARLNLLTVLVLLIIFLLVLATVGTLSTVLANRAGKPFGLSRADCRRLAYKPTDSPFWRDPRILQVLRGTTTDTTPTTPQEFVSQILAATGRLTPVTGSVSAESPAAARRLQDAITAAEREIGTMEKAAPREAIERIEAELVLLESEGADPELLAVLQSQREALLRSRERLQMLNARRESAAAALETLWRDVRKLASTTEPAQVRELAEKVSAQCAAVQVAFPSRRTRTTTGAGTGAMATLALLAVAGGVAIAAQPAGSEASARALLDRAQPDSALTILATLPETSVERHALTGRAYLLKGSERGIVSRITAARGAVTGFEAARARDPQQAEALESLAWLRRLLPVWLGGAPRDVPALLRTLEAAHPYRAQLLRGYFARLDRHDHVADSLFRHLTVTAPDSAPAWFALGENAAELGRAEEAMAAYQRYRTLMPNDPSVLYLMGRLSARDGIAFAAGEEALKAYLAVPERSTLNTHAAARWRLGMIYEKQGRVADARAQYEQAVTLDKRDPDFRASLDSLRLRSGR